MELKFAIIKEPELVEIDIDNLVMFLNSVCENISLENQSGNSEYYLKSQTIIYPKSFDN